MKRELIKSIRQQRRVKRVRKKIHGTADYPRLAVSRSARQIYAQLINDEDGRTLCALGSRSKELSGQFEHGGNAKAASAVGKALGEKAKQLGIEHVRFDRRGRRFHGRVKALAEAVREAGVKF